MGIIEPNINDLNDLIINTLDCFSDIEIQVEKIDPEEVFDLKHGKVFADKIRSWVKKGE